MILRKPYAFLIKNFRIIHFLLTGLLIFIATQTNKMYTFFKDYIRDSSYLKIYIEPAITSVPIYIYLVLFLSLGIFVAIFFLMNKKKKPTKYYFASIVFYLILIISFVFANSQLFSLLQDQAHLKIVSLIRDLLKVLYYIQYIFITIALVRTIGFNIKKFDFKDDLIEMDISIEDNEEFEVEVELDSNDIRTKLRRALRITKYVINENKKLFIVILSTIVIYAVSSVFLDIFVYNRVYRQNQTFRHGDLQLKVLNSYQSTKDYSLNDISFNKYIYYTVLFEVKNNSSKPRTLNINNIKLKVSKYKSYETDNKSYSKFLDVGVGYYAQKLQPNSTNKYIFVFKVDKEYENESKTFEILKNITSRDGEVSFNYTKVKIKPINTDKINEKNNSKIKKELKIKDSIVGDINLKIDEMAFVNKVEHNYKETINDKEYSFTNVILPSYDDYYGKKIMKLKLNLECKNVSNENVMDKFIGNFGHIRYSVKGKEYTNPFRLIERTPEDEKEYKYIEVYEKVSDADNIWLDIIIRNDKYVYKLK